MIWVRFTHELSPLSRQMRRFISIINPYDAYRLTVTIWHKNSQLCQLAIRDLTN